VRAAQESIYIYIVCRVKCKKHIEAQNVYHKNRNFVAAVK